MQANSRRNIRVFDNASTIAGVPKSILFFASVLPVVLMMQGTIIIGAMILAIIIPILLHIYKEDERALSIWVYSLAQRHIYWESGVKRSDDLVILRKKDI